MDVKGFTFRPMSVPAWLMPACAIGLAALEFIVAGIFCAIPLFWSARWMFYVKKYGKESRDVCRMARAAAWSLALVGCAGLVVSALIMGSHLQVKG